MASGQERKEMDNRAKEGETVVPGGKSLTAQERLAEGRSKGGQTRKEQLGKEGYQEMGRKGGFSNYGMSGVGADEEGIQVDESKFHTNKEGTGTDESKFHTTS